MGLRPASAYREVKGQAWTRFSRHKPRKSFVKSKPGSVLRKFEMGDIKGKYEVELDVITVGPIQLRDNALEASRQSIHKHLDVTCPGKYFFKVRVFPHNVLRENKMITGAGADRLQTGMQRAFGRPIRIAARLRKNQVVYTIRFMKADFPHVKEALKRGTAKLSGHYYIDIKDLTKVSS